MNRLRDFFDSAISHTGTALREGMDDPIRKAGVTLSATFHLLILYLVIFGLPKSSKIYELDVARPVSVQIVKASDAPQRAKPAPPPSPQKAPPAKPVPPKPEPVKKEAPALPTAVKEKAPPAEAKKVAEPVPLQPVVKNLLDEPAPPPPPVIEEKKEPEKDEFEDVLSAVASLQKQEKAPAVTTDLPVIPQSGDKPISDEVILAIKQTIERCWIIPAGARNADTLIVEVAMILSPEGRVMRAEIVDSSRMASDPFFRTAAESALRAVYHPDCNPLPVPLDAYDKWRNIRLRFNPKEMLGP